MAKATVSTIVTCPSRAALKRAAEAPVGLRIAATTTSVSRAILISHMILLSMNCRNITDIVARFPDGRVKITNFSSIAKNEGSEGGQP